MTVSLFRNIHLFCGLLLAFMRRILSEKFLVAVLFVLVFITYFFAQQATRNMEKAYLGIQAKASASLADLAVKPVH